MEAPQSYGPNFPLPSLTAREHQPLLSATAGNLDLSIYVEDNKIRRAANGALKAEPPVHDRSLTGYFNSGFNRHISGSNDTIAAAENDVNALIEQHKNIYQSYSNVNLMTGSYDEIAVIVRNANKINDIVNIANRIFKNKEKVAKPIENDLLISNALNYFRNTVEYLAERWNLSLRDIENTLTEKTERHQNSAPTVTRLIKIAETLEKSENTLLKKDNIFRQLTRLVPKLKSYERGEAEKAEKAAKAAEQAAAIDAEVRSLMNIYDF